MYNLASQTLTQLPFPSHQLVYIYLNEQYYMYNAANAISEWFYSTLNISLQKKKIDWKTKSIYWSIFLASTFK